MQSSCKYAAPCRAPLSNGDMTRISIPGHRAPTVGFEVPLEMLSACHLRIEAQLETLRRLVPYLANHGSDDEARAAASSVMRYFDTSAMQHHADEEEDLFPALLESMAGSDPVCLREMTQSLVAEHRDLETRWRRLASFWRRSPPDGQRRSTTQTWKPLPASTRVTSNAKSKNCCRWRRGCWATASSIASDAPCARDEASKRLTEPLCK